ncbi:MAG: hypothetical protein HKP27_03525, partial [Myxococcales bacterium]|nr:hypothetical protein [Myxococcales bacterium]
GVTSAGELSFTPAEPSFGSPETTGSATLPIAEAEFVASPPQSGADATAVTRDPSFRQDLHDAIEKIAWEAMGPVAEALVRECVDKVERVAWEVIPEMAEKLIREEIRKLKSEG